MSVEIFPSFLSANFAYIADEAKRLEDAGSDGIHLDIMDGHFVPNLSMGPKIVETINRSTDLFLDVHLMMYNPYDYVEKFIEAGADMISFHFEATEDVEDVLNYIRKAGKKAVLAFNPETSISMIPKYLDKCDAMLFMAVKPGFSGQSFMPEVLEKIEFTRGLCDKLNIRDGGVSLGAKSKTNLPPFKIQVDGGVNLQTAKLCVEKGANILVSGNYLFSQKDLEKAIQGLRNC
jgi:ribulose-phosphate 3-epimerase